MYHYLHTAEGNYREYLKAETVWLKKYFYVLRPLLACKWIEANQGPPPIEFDKLLEATVTSENLKQDITKFSELKKQGQELDKGPKIPTISTFIEKELEKLRAGDLKKVNLLELESLNRLFRDTLKRLWN